jgi:hypothetical protein
MSALLKKRTSRLAAVTAGPSGEDRAALKRAIDDAATAQRHLHSGEAAREAALTHVDAAQERLVATEAAVERARQAHAQTVASALAAGQEPPSASAVTDARTTAVEAKDQLDAAEAAAQALKDELPGLRTDLAIAENRIVGACNGVLVEPLKQWLERAQRGRAEVLLCTEVLSALTDDLDLDRGLPDPALDSVQRVKAMAERTAPLGALRDEARRWLMNIAGDVDPADQTKANDAATSWRQVRAALRSDADVSLPEVPR